MESRLLKSVLTLMLAIATPLVAQAATQQPAGYAPFTGRWACTSAGSPASTYAFGISPDRAWLVMNATAGRATFANHYHRDALGAWVTTQYGSDGSTYQGHSDGWNRLVTPKMPSLVFEGVARTTQTQTHTRETWVMLAPGKLQRIWSDLNGTTWTTTSTTECLATN